MTEREDTDDLFDAAARAPAAQPIPEPAAEAAAGDASIGRQLRAAREMRGLTLADCGRSLHLPWKALERLEGDDFGAAEDFVFLRGALRGYARLLDVPAARCDAALQAVAPAAQPALVAVARTSHTRWLLQRYGTAATYIVLTATIAVPLVLLGLRGGLHRPAEQIVSLDQPAASAHAAASATVKPAVAPIVVTPDTTPFRASIAPFGAMGLDGASAAPTVGAVAAAPAGQHTLAVNASADCWFEITDADGNKVDSGMLHAGDSRTWQSTGVLHVILGNARGVTVARDGQPLDLASYARSNVAHFDVFGPQGASEND